MGGIGNLVGEIRSGLNTAQRIERAVERGPEGALNAALGVAGQAGVPTHDVRRTLGAGQHGAHMLQEISGKPANQQHEKQPASAPASAPSTQPQPASQPQQQQGIVLPRSVVQDFTSSMQREFALATDKRNDKSNKDTYSSIQQDRERILSPLTPEQRSALLEIGKQEIELYKRSALESASRGKKADYGQKVVNLQCGQMAERLEILCGQHGGVQVPENSRAQAAQCIEKNCSPGRAGPIKISPQELCASLEKSLASLEPNQRAKLKEEIVQRLDSLLGEAKMRSGNLKGTEAKDMQKRTQRLEELKEAAAKI